MSRSKILGVGAKGKHIFKEGKEEEATDAMKDLKVWSVYGRRAKSEEE